ncbi:MAG: peptidoglycan-associated lipoprotein Pal [Desulfopila sp.]
MKQRIGTVLFLAACTGSLLFTGGCAKKALVPPDSGISTSSSRTGSYPPADGSEFSEGNLSAVGSLDDAAGNGLGNNDSTSDEYKRLHGRTSLGMDPVYFDFDQAVIRPDMADRMVNNAEFLKHSPAVRIVVEGNTDERGTSEYNLALAERRAQNTKQYLVRLGIDSGRIRTVSYGEERPLFLGQDEDSYAQNRRADFVVE